MKLRNKKTGGMGKVDLFDGLAIVIYPIDSMGCAIRQEKFVYHSLAELCGEEEE